MENSCPLYLSLQAEKSEVAQAAARGTALWGNTPPPPTTVEQQSRSSCLTDAGNSGCRDERAAAHAAFDAPTTAAVSSSTRPYSMHLAHTPPVYAWACACCCCCSLGLLLLLVLLLQLLVLLHERCGSGLGQLLLLVLLHELLLRAVRATGRTSTSARAACCTALRPFLPLPDPNGSIHCGGIQLWHI